jgi:hypothetical protein
VEVLMKKGKTGWTQFLSRVNWDASVMFFMSLESSQRGGVHGYSMMFGFAVQKFFENWMISSLKIKLNRSWKFQRNWNVPLVLLERSWWAGFNYFIFYYFFLLRFGFRMWEILIFKVNSATENSNKFQKTRF